MAKFATVEEAIDEIRNGNMIIVVDDEDREPIRHQNRKPTD